MSSIQGISKRVLLVICDGMGLAPKSPVNAVTNAHTPNLDELMKKHPFTKLEPGGVRVGLPKGVAGNSEVGHMNLGAGQSVRQDLVRINEAIEKDNYKNLPKLNEFIQSSDRLHLMTLLSDGGVHSHIDHLKATLNILRETKKEVFLHVFMDGRDTPFNSGEKYLKDILNFGGFTLASMQGRSIGMDRDRRWEKIQTAVDTMTGKKGSIDQSPQEYLLSCYHKEEFDEFITPALFHSDSAIKKDDAVFFLNFRPDRAKQISEAFCSDKFSHFDNSIRPTYFLCMSPYIDEDFPKVPILFNREKVKGTLVEYLSQNAKKVFKIAETEKYAHVTYFFNGGEEKEFPGEQRVLIPSPKDVSSYDQKPQMSAPLVLERLKEKLKDPSFSLYVANFANPDMVGHTGNYEATLKAMEEVDRCLGELKDVCEKEKITMLITADHGNCDQMKYDDGQIQTSHSKAPVPFIVYHPEDIQFDEVNKEHALCDVAPTIIKLLGLKKHDIMTGESIYQ